MYQKPSFVSQEELHRWTKREFRCWRNRNRRKIFLQKRPSLVMNLLKSILPTCTLMKMVSCQLFDLTVLECFCLELCTYQKEDVVKPYVFWPDLWRMKNGGHLERYFFNIRMVAYGWFFGFGVDLQQIQWDSKQCVPWIEQHKIKYAHAS